MAEGMPREGAGLPRPGGDAQGHTDCGIAIAARRFSAIFLIFGPYSYRNASAGRIRDAEYDG